MPLPVAVRRLAYRTAYRALQLFWLLRRPAKAGVKCLLTDENRVLLVRHTYGDRVWDLPGGALKRHEDPRNAAEREMHEELGIDGVDWVSLGAVRGISHHRRDTIHCYGAELAQPTLTLTLDLGELATASWFACGDLPPDLGPYVIPVLARAPVLRAEPAGD